MQAVIVNPRPTARRMLTAWVLVVAGSLLMAPLRAENMRVTTADIALGGHVSGPAIGPQGLAGRVVVLEFWGIHCPPCIASMPKLEQLHTQLGPQGLLVIGAHAQGGPADDIRRTVAELGVTFTIVENATVNGGMDFDGIPHCMVFDHSGACVYRGSPNAAREAVMAAVKAAPAAILAGRTLEKLAPLAETLRNEASLGIVLKKARSLLDSSDADTADEAQFVVERIEGRGREMLTEARGLAATDPAAAVALAQRCVASFKGSDVGTEAGGLLQEWRQDKEFQSAVKAGVQLARLEELCTAVKRAPGGPPPQVARQVRDLVRAIEKGWPGSAAAERAAAIAAEIAPESAAAP